MTTSSFLSSSKLRLAAPRVAPAARFQRIGNVALSRKHILRMIPPVQARVQGEDTDHNAEQQTLDANVPVESTGNESDWEKEMSIFKQRTLRPNQLATLRELQSQVDVGKVLFCQDGIAIIEGLNNDAPVGTKLSFVSGATGVLLWWRSESLCFALVLGGSNNVAAGQAVECNVAGILQVVDEADGPMTKREYELFKVPVGPSLVGHVVDFLGRPQGSPSPLGLEHMLPLLNKQLPIEAREPISESLLTGVKAVDALTPIGKGQQMLVLGGKNTGKTEMAVDAVLGQKGNKVRCILALVGCSQQELTQVTATLEAHDAMEYTTVVACPAGSPLGEQYAALTSACSMGERIREEGGHSMVVLDSVGCAVEVWELFTWAVAQLGEDKIAQGLFKTSQGEEINMPAPQTQQQLVEYEGMMVTAAAAMRRSFFTSLLQRAARADKRHGGGTTAMLATMAGRPATGQSAQIDMTKYKTLREDLKQKMIEALKKKMAAAQEAAPGEIRTEVIEEFMSISDGQVVLEPRSSNGQYVVSPQLSISRIGSRAYYKAMETLAPHIRFALAQAADAVKFSSDPNDPVTQSQKQTADRLRTALSQPAGRPCSLGEQVVTLYIMQQEHLDSVDLQELPSLLNSVLTAVHEQCPEVLQEVEDTKIFTAASEKKVDDIVAALLAQQQQQQQAAPAS